MALIAMVQVKKDNKVFFISLLMSKFHMNTPFLREPSKVYQKRRVAFELDNQAFLVMNKGNNNQ
jgi:hypothetical protein